MNQLFKSCYGILTTLQNKMYILTWYTYLTITDYSVLSDPLQLNIHKLQHVRYKDKLK